MFTETGFLDWKASHKGLRKSSFFGAGFGFGGLGYPVPGLLLCEGFCGVKFSTLVFGVFGLRTGVGLNARRNEMLL